MKSMKGFTLTEVLVSIAIVGIAVAGIAVVSSNILKMSNVTNSSAQFNSSVGELAGFLSDETSCRLALGGPGTYGTQVPGSTAQPMNTSGTTNIKIYTPVISVPRPVFIDPADPLHNKFGQWRVTALQIQPMTGTASPPGPVPARITITMTGPDGQIRIANNIYLSAMLDGSNNIYSCFGITYGTSANLIPICAANSAAFSTGTQVTCVHVKCTAGMPCGWDGSGNVICQPTCP